LGAKDIEGKQTYLGSKVWRNPKVVVEEVDVPKPGIGEVVIEVKACGICGSDVHMAQPEDDGYIFYPGLTGFPCTLGHEFSGIIAEADPQAYDKSTNKPFKGGEWVTSEEMLWCGTCRPCADGYPNHCERLDEVGFNVDGAFAKYIKVPAKVCWSIESFKGKYDEKDIFKLGSLVEPSSVAYNAVIERGGGIRPGDNVLILGGGPIGLAACAILKRMGAARVILSEPEESRAKIAEKLGADFVINPLKESLSETVLKITKGMGASIYLEATGLPTVVYPEIEKIIWEGKTLNSTVVVVARADAKIPVTGEVLQVRRAGMIGAQGHSGHGTFPRVIESIADGMNMLPLITKEIKIDEVPANIIELRTNKKECKITCIM
ncbi:MAG: zinc-binding dehydrogenase, partial [Actinobacteria bacterium]|nr:zinc-binding dehydrogenase [Actinomycetota bacterium]